MISIRKAEKKDLNQIYTIELLSFKNPYPKYLFNAFLNNTLFLFLVCLINKEIVGYIVASRNNSGHIISLAVHPEFRRRGVGSILLEETLKLMKNEGVLLIKLEVNENNNSAINFYKKHGFKILRKIKKYYEDGSNALLLYKRLK